MLTVSPVGPGELLPAARLLFATASEADREPRANRFAELVTTGEIDPAGLLLAKRHGTPVGTAVVQRLPGGSAVVVPPSPEGGPASDTLASAIDSFLRAGPSVIAHVFLDPPEVSKADPLLAHGFAPAATITHMLRDLDHLPPTARGLTFEPSHRHPELFGQTLLATYTASLDVPEANTDRPAEDILAGYRLGQPDVPHWWLAHDENGEAVGVLLLTPPRFAPTWEVGYLGVVPAARGRGFAAELVRFGLHTLAEMGVKHVTLSVDARNEPALGVYRRLGFTMYHEQRVFLWRR